MNATITRKPLLAAGVYEQPWQDRLKSDTVVAVKGTIFADAAGTLYVDASDDGGITASELTNVSVNVRTTAELNWLKLTKRWYRFRYVNSETAQDEFILVQEITKTSGIKITNTAGDEDVSIVANLGDEETFVNALATVGFMLQHDAATGNYKRFTGKVVPIDTAGNEIFTDNNPASIKLTGSRTAVIAHRAAITAVDKVPTVTITATNSDVGGSLTAVNHGVAVAPGNAYGSCGISNIVVVTPAAGESIDIFIPQAVGAAYYDVLVSPSTTAPFWVGRITEEQRAAGCTITAIGVVETGGQADSVNVKVVGAGTGTAVATSAIYAANNAYVFGAIETISCVGKTKAYIYTRVAIDNLGAAPSVGIVPFFRKNDTSINWYATDVNLLSVLGGLGGQPLSQVVVVDINAVKELVVLVDVLAGNGTTVDIDVELY